MLMITADQGHLNIFEYIITEYRNVIDIDSKNEVSSIVTYYMVYCVLMCACDNGRICKSVFSCIYYMKLFIQFVYADIVF